ncbi:MAG: nucleotidyltransferase domain-containing protein [Ruminococcus sp.]|nr:nucleotidyltransferase domain-containing protein [Ruminococcus sp.]
MIEIKKWLESFLRILQETFGERIEFVGLQGSYARGEATENSDIDIVVIFNELNIEDIKKYNDILDTLPDRNLICGFISGKNELVNWEPSDLFQFYFDTIPIKGSIDYLLDFLNDETISRAIKIGACNIYHACVHNMLHEKDKELLKGLYKSASFVVQAIYYKQSGVYIRHQKELLKVVNSKEQEIIKVYLKLKIGEDIEFEKMSDLLFAWAKDLICFE